MTDIKKEIGYIQEPKNIEEAHHNSQFQLDNVIGWFSIKDYECTLIKAECLVKELKNTIAIKKEAP